MPEDLKPVRRALLSVSDKQGLIEFATFLAHRNIILLSTGGTASRLKKAGLDVIDVQDVTQFPEMMDGRVKTLHPKIHGGLLSVDDNPAHQKALHEHQIEKIDLLVVNLYPFEQTLLAQRPFHECIENIDIGGPAMIRAAAKNHENVTVVVDPDDYKYLMEEVEEKQGATSLLLRRKLAQKAFARVAAYDAAISNWFASENEEKKPVYRAFGGSIHEALRYGENPHQSAAFYALPVHSPGVATARQVQGKQLSYNNIQDTNAAFECVAEFSGSIHAAVAIIKHANPCGVAVDTALESAFEKALRCDPVSAFGGIIALNQVLDVDTARKISQLFAEVVIAPGAHPEALEILSAKKNVRILLTEGMPDPREERMVFTSVSGGFLVQTCDNKVVEDMDLKVVTKRFPTEKEWVDLKFAYQVVKHVKSNAIVYVKDGATVGIGAGQMSRVDSSRIAAWKASEAAKLAQQESLTVGSVVASDAFFPFADGLLAAVEAGATAVIQPGGSMRDPEVIEAADAHGLAMVFTGYRHFRH